MIVLCNPMQELENIKPKGEKGLGWDSGLFEEQKRKSCLD